MDMHEWIDVSDLASYLSYHYYKYVRILRPTIHAPCLPVYGTPFPVFTSFRLCSF
jgi:hypothetical protein